MVTAASAVNGSGSEAAGIDDARKGVVKYLRAHGAPKASDALDAVERDLSLDEMTVKRAFWQLLSDGIVKLDSTYHLHLIQDT